MAIGTLLLLALKAVALRDAGLKTRAATIITSQISR